MAEDSSSDSKESKKDLKQLFSKELSRRKFLQTTGLFTGIGLTGMVPFSFFAKNTAPFAKTTSKTQDYPFRLGVASGDPLPDGVVLWTRLAPDPLSGGGMGSEPADVQWEVAEDETFQNIVQQGTYVAKETYGHSVHVEVEGLQPNHWYYYRFKVGDEVSPTGRTKTAPVPGSSIDQMNFAIASCQNYKAGYYTAYDHLVSEDLDLVFFLGDYIYEGGSQGDIGRGHRPKKGIFSLDEYRIRYGQYKSDPSLKDAHAAFPWIVAFDDHEVRDNWAGDSGPPYANSVREHFLTRREAAFQAFYEHMPLRISSLPKHNEMSLYRKFTYGNLAEFSVLDTRQYRTDFACDTSRTVEQCKEQYDPSRTLLGKKQENWLFNNLRNSSSRWNVLPQQVMMAQWDRKEGRGTAFNMDKWDGYRATRNRLFNVIKEDDVQNLVVLTGDSHKNWVNDLKEDFNDPSSRTLGTEFMGTSISSGGNGANITKRGEQALRDNPHIKFYNEQRGYVLCKLTPEQWKTDFRVVPFVDKPGAPVHTRASFVVKNGNPGAVQL